MIPQQIIDALKKVFAFVDDKLKVSDSQLDVALSTRASESTLSAIKSQTDKLSFVNDRLKTSQQDDLLIRGDRTTTTDEFIPSGMEFAFNNYTVSSGTETRLDGKLILKTLTVEGSIIINGTVEFD